jgi:glycosyltransferase involved in cell wall biosynthesis
MTFLRRVLVVQRQLEHYRIPFFEALRAEMPRRGCELILAYGDPDPSRAPPRQPMTVEWARRLPTAQFFGGRLCIQPFAHLLDKVDAVVLAAENKMINNLRTQFMPGKSRVVLWGHGANLQGRDHTLRERFKRHVARQADWWLGYTEVSRPLIARSGFPAERVTILNNAIDTVGLAAMKSRVTTASQEVARLKFGIQGSQVGVFMGSLYGHKHIPFLLAAALEIKRRIPDFELLVIGDGPDRSLVDDFCRQHRWAHALGAMTGPEMADAVSLGRVMLNPGLVGLSILDSFVFTVPMLTTDCGVHSPEIAYLDHDRNGIMTRYDRSEYAQAAAALLTNDAQRLRLQIGCADSAGRYTVERMARRFAEGVDACLGVPAWRYSAGARRKAPRPAIGQSSSKPSVALVTNVVPVYRYPIYQRLNQNGHLKFQIFVTMPLAESCPEALESIPIKHSYSINLQRTTHHAASGTTQREPLSIPVALAWDLLVCRPDLIIAGDLGVRSLVCWIVAKLVRARFILSSEDIASSAVGRTSAQHCLRRFLVKRADACLAWGDSAAQYLKTLGVQDDRVYSCAQAINNDHWMRLADSMDRSSERAALGLTGVVFLLVGRALRRKGFQNFLEAWARLPAASHGRICAVIVGDGDYLGDLKAQATTAGLTNVRFAGSQPAEQLARYYAAADIFVLPSLEDVWGLVVNEAMCFGLPVLASQFAGASQSLVAGSDVGVVFNPANIEQFSQRLLEWAVAPPPQAITACRRRLEHLTFDRSISALDEMITQLGPERIAASA